ncbi:hypothetical protein [Candidatus Absconditicoccus praedator]|uniref:hypothetical protein n=1 Tax=Candidatus Absconditicoccus praedator TaxID=2735562 RepID=UPI001E520D32|nr:hypothetical protein [Candidatus Absconditicoccus praedator]UFX82792.1 hypothetical protein HLG78_01425 [Candidatus Absconditicoccus praedator]
MSKIKQSGMSLISSIAAIVIIGIAIAVTTQMFVAITVQMDEEEPTEYVEERIRAYYLAQQIMEHKENEEIECEEIDCNDGYCSFREWEFENAESDNGICTITLENGSLEEFDFNYTTN